MFTSGSSGEPKGVAVTEGNLRNLLDSVADDPGMVPSDRFLALTPVSFDISLLELLLPLTVGASIEIVPDAVRRDGRALAASLNNPRITVAQATPSTWRALRDVGWEAASPITILCGGEHLEEELAQYLLSQNGALYAMYGPTETTIWAGWHRVSDARDVTLGIPARGTNYYVVDESGNSVDAGVIGELVIEGRSVARGYLNSSDAPFGSLQAGIPAYRTGDLVRHHGGGRVVFIGRKDEQRKINGYRVEPGEIAAVVRAALPGATVFIVVGKQPEPHIRCFVWKADGDLLDLESVRHRCKQYLPHYLVPKVIRRLRTVPVTQNGKSDVGRMADSALEDLDLWPEDRRASSADQSRGDSSILAQLRNLVADELNVPPPDVDDPLGYQGISSLSFSVLAARIHDRFGMDFRAHDFYRLPTLRELASAVTSSGGDGIPRSQERSSDGPAKLVPACDGCPSQHSSTNDHRLAIIGMDAVLPGGSSPDDFWSFLMNGRSAVKGAEPRRGLGDDHAAFIDSVRSFDARFFAISPLEASWMDPRQRLLLQSCWHSIENAGIPPHGYAEVERVPMWRRQEMTMRFFRPVQARNKRHILW